MIESQNFFTTYYTYIAVQFFLRLIEQRSILDRQNCGGKILSSAVFRTPFNNFSLRKRAFACNGLPTFEENKKEGEKNLPKDRASSISQALFLMDPGRFFLLWSLCLVWTVLPNHKLFGYSNQACSFLSILSNQHLVYTVLKYDTLHYS